MKNKKKIVLKSENIKKTLKDFVADEDGFVSKETMLRVGLSTVAGIGVLGAMSDACAWHSNTTTHTNLMTFSTGTGAGGCIVPEAAAHANAAVHCSHSSY